MKKLTESATANHLYARHNLGINHLVAVIENSSYEISTSFYDF